MSEAGKPTNEQMRGSPNKRFIVLQNDNRHRNLSSLVGLQCITLSKSSDSVQMKAMCKKLMYLSAYTGFGREMALNRALDQLHIDRLGTLLAATPSPVPPPAQCLNQRASTGSKSKRVFYLGLTPIDQIPVVFLPC